MRVRDIIDKKLGKAIPYGVYDVGLNNPWVSVGVDHDTAEFAVESIARWRRTMGKKAYPDATELLIIANGGGSKGYRSRPWNVEFQRLADRSDVVIASRIFHLARPSGTRSSTASSAHRREPERSSTHRA